MELYVFDVNQRSLGFTAAGANVSMGTTYGSNFASYGGDNLADPIALIATQQFANSGCAGTTTADYYQAVFPGGAPALVSTVYFVNRDDGNNGRITQCACAVDPSGLAYAPTQK